MGKQGKGRFASCALAVAALAVFSVTGLCGCVFSDTITEKVYDSDEQSLVDATVEPVLVNTVDAKETSDEMPSLDYNPKSDSKDDTKVTLPVYSDDASKAASELPAPRPRYNKKAGKEGEVSVKAKKTPETKTEQATKQEAETQSDIGSEEKESDDGEKSSKKAGKKKGSNKKKSSEKKGTGKRSSGGTGSVYDNDPDSEEPVIPENIDEVAAVGNNAVIVAMVSGTADSSALVACDKDTQKKAARVLEKRGIGKAKALWGGDGSSAGSLTDANFKKLTDDVVPDLIFVTEGVETLTDSQKKKLAKKNIDVYTLPALTSAKRIKFAVETVGKILEQGGVKDVKKNYKQYLDFHDELVEKYEKTNGGITGDYDFYKEAEAKDSAADTIVTLYIDAWDSKARYNDKSDVMSTPSGIAVASLGYKSAPVSYYLSMGGAFNNAASKIMRNQDTDERGVVWQFAQNELSYSFKWWSGLDEATYDLCAHISGGVFKSDLLWYTAPGATGFGLGTKSFPGVIVKSGKIASSMDSSSSKTGSPYFPYPLIAPATSGKTIGYFVGESDEDYVEACIGSDGTGKQAMDGEMYGIYTNPKGLCKKTPATPCARGPMAR